MGRNALEGKWLQRRYTATTKVVGAEVSVQRFTEKLRIFNVLVSELRVYREFSVRGARHLTFSPGGNLLACALQKVIVVYDAMFIHSKLERICSNF